MPDLLALGTSTAVGRTGSTHSARHVPARADPLSRPIQYCRFAGRFRCGGRDKALRSGVGRFSRSCCAERELHAGQFLGYRRLTSVIAARNGTTEST
ncbi:hypothetical protein, partial [Nocardia carnea]|uniref:hypothetical protein n=1 Tax=Nocardia carnea TaxID=37328 RepID=UPI002455C5CF